MKNWEKVIAKAVDVLNQGGILLYPTDTIWGLGCDATNEYAVQRVFHLKKRPASKSMILLIENPALFQSYTKADMQIYAPFLTQNEEPQTVIIPKAYGLAKSVIPPENTVAVRCPKHPFCQALLKAFQKPLVSTSANFSGDRTPVLFKDISEDICTGADFIIPANYENGSTGQASRIIKIENDKIIRLR